MLPWFDKDEQAQIEINIVPEDQFTCIKFFQRFQPKNESFAYGEIKFQLKRIWEDIIFDLPPWLNKNTWRGALNLSKA
jgi:hypothetical protein